MTKAIIVMNGGIIQNVVTDEDVDVTVVDYDTEGADLDDLKKVHGNDAYVFGPHTEVDKDEVENILNMIKDTEEE
jgi:hypothetical protein